MRQKIKNHHKSYGLKAFPAGNHQNVNLHLVSKKWIHSLDEDTT